MTHDPDIRRALKTRLDKIAPEHALPERTLVRARRRRRGAMGAVALGGLASALLIFTGFQFVGSSGSPGNGPSGSSPSPAGSTAPPEEEVVLPTVTEPRDADDPPPVTVTGEDRSFELAAWSYCYGTICASGSPPRDPSHVGSPEEVAIDFPLRDWSFVAWFTPEGQPCGRSQKAPVEATTDGTFVLHPVGHADTYDIMLSGKGSEGSLSVTFRWTTPVDGPLPEPQARAAIVTDDGPNTTTSYGVELELKNLAETPQEASATITVEAADGNSVTFEAERARGGCRPEGTVYWDGPAEKGPEAAALGQAPFKYRIEVVLDGTRYIGTATWPEDEIRGNEPSVALRFTPELPRVR